MRTRSVIDITETNRDENPVYRIDFWERPAADFAWNNDIWLVEEAPNVSAVIEWADAHAKGRRYQLLVLSRTDADGDDFVLLAGDNPNDPRTSRNTEDG